MASEETQPMQWHSPNEQPFRLSGFAWYEQDQRYRRLPIAPEWTVPPPVDHLANHTAGGQIAFRTDSRRIWVKAKLKAVADMVHMPATGQCGFDLYIGEPGAQVFYGATKYDLRATEYEYKLIEMSSTELRHVTINFPLYQGVEEVLIGLDHDARVLAPVPYAMETRVIFYGTSITQGGCASRPGMAYPNILSRRMNIEAINLGFSGSGKGEPELAHLITQISRPSCLVLDYEANCVSTELFAETLPQFIRIYRELHPQIPILVVSRIPFSHDVFHAETMQARRERGDLQRNTVRALQDAGDNKIHFFDGTALLKAHWDECTVDGIHPTDLGFMQMADGLEPVLRGILRLQ